jgi:mediator of RNA polymerase II transcription subunit 7
MSFTIPKRSLLSSLDFLMRYRQAEEKKEDLRVLFINFHHLLNEYRPHQARESLILMMQDQLDKSRAETLGIKAMKEKVEGILVGLGQMQVVEKEEDTIMGEDIAVNQEVQEGKDVWDELEREFG